jgi:hypothetical protein
VKLLYKAPDIVEAHILQDWLRAGHVQAQIQGEFLQGAVGEIPASGLISVWVNDDDFVPAQRILSDWRQAMREGVSLAGEVEADAEPQVDPAGQIKLQTNNQSRFSASSLTSFISGVVFSIGIALNNAFIKQADLDPSISRPLGSIAILFLFFLPMWLFVVGTNHHGAAPLRPILKRALVWLAAAIATAQLFKHWVS